MINHVRAEQLPGLCSSLVQRGAALRDEQQLLLCTAPSRTWTWVFTRAIIRADAESYLVLRNSIRRALMRYWRIKTIPGGVTSAGQRHQAQVGVGGIKMSGQLSCTSDED